MGKRKSSKKPSAPRRKETLDQTFTCLFCHHENSVTVRVDRKEGIAQLVCKICDQRFQSKVNHLTEAVDIYSMWVDAADEAEKEQVSTRPRPAASGRRPEYSAAAVSDDEDD